MSMEVTVAKESDRTLWDEVVTTSDHGTLFHTWDWLKLMEKHNMKKIGPLEARGRLYPLIFRQGEEVVGLIPFFIYDFPMVRLLCSPPFSVEDYYLGPVFKRYDALKSHRRQAMVQEFHEVLSAHIFDEVRPSYISIHTPPFFSDPRPFIWGGYTVTPEFTNIIPLRGDLRHIEDEFSHSARNMINKLNLAGMEAFTGSREDVKFIYARLADAGRIHAQKEFVLDVYDRFHGSNMRVIMVKRGEEILNGIVCLSFNNRACVWLGSPKVAGTIPNPNYLAHREAVRWAHERKFTSLELIGASDRLTTPFKRQFGGELVPFYSVKWHSPLMALARGLLA